MTDDMYLINEHRKTLEENVAKSQKRLLNARDKYDFHLQKLNEFEERKEYYIKEIQNDDTPVCIICRDQILSCHVSVDCFNCVRLFHYSCLNDQVKVNPSCPTCREKFSLNKNGTLSKKRNKL